MPNQTPSRIECHPQNDQDLIQQRCRVYLPPGYDESKERHYPVLYLLSGIHDDARTWAESSQCGGDAKTTLDNLIQQDVIRPLVVVMPKTNDWNHQHQQLHKDLPPLIKSIEKVYTQVQSNKTHRAIAGISKGACQALEAGLQPPDLFSATGSFSAALKTQFDPSRTPWTVLPLNSGDYAGLQFFYITCGKQDTLFQANQEFTNALASLGIKHIAHYPDGGHNWNCWRTSLQPFLIALNNSGWG